MQMTQTFDQRPGRFKQNAFAILLFHKI